MIQEPVFRLQPIYQTRVWGGRSLATRYGRELPDDASPFGESWEISARDEADTQVISGSLSGKTLTELWRDESMRGAIFGSEAPEEEAFPLLCKILDARERLSIQVHPPAAIAPEMGGEPKSEVWYVAHAEPGAVLYVGVKEGVTSESFREAIESGTAEDCVHQIPVQTGEHIYIPSGRLHAIGSGLVIYEIQQNSDTTYRVFDWNRVGIDGAPRELHIEESMRCIDFSDVTPEMDEPNGSELVDCAYFRLERHALGAGVALEKSLAGRFAILTVISGVLEAGDKKFQEADFMVIPAMGSGSGLRAGDGGAEYLLTTWPS
ncbi:MAG: type I phosphomannose isomerase catalytic subunit [Verrucomicrobiota bacterium]